jgi:hypothetical protein
MKERTRPVAGAELVCALPQEDIMPEDIAYEPSTGGFIVSSIQHHTLYRVTLPKAGEQKCSLEELPLEASAKRWPVLAVSADAKRKLLWMTTSAMPGFTGFPKEDEGKAALLAVEAKTGKTVRRFDLDAGAPAALGDMSLAPDGAVYVTDSVGGGVYRVRGDLATAKLEKIADGLFSPQTPALARDGKRLFVADYTMGIAVVDLTGSAPVAYLPHPENIAVVGLDGLYLAGDALVGIQNGTEPERIVRYRLDPTQTKILSAEVLEQAREHFGDATHAAAKGGSFYVSANVGWSQVDDRGKLKPGAHFTAPVILRLPAKRK